MQTNSVMKSKKDGTWVGDFLCFAFVLLMLLCFYPYEFYSAYFMLVPEQKMSTYVSMLILTVAFAVFFYKRKPDIPSSLFIIVAIQAIGLTFCFMAKGGKLPTGPIMIMILSVAIVAFLSATCGLESFYKKYNRWLLIMAVLGTLSFFLIWAGALQPLMPFVDLSDEDIMFNYGITFSQRDEMDLFQYCGFFDEPGAMASWGMYGLLFNRLFVKDERLEIILIISLIATFSLGYYMQLIVYVFLFRIATSRKSSVVKNSFFLVFALIVIVFTLYSLEGTQYDEIYQKSMGRVENIFSESNKGQGLAIDDRENLTLEAQKEFEANPLWGTTKENVEVGNNLYEPLALYGIVGTFFLYLPFLYLLIKSFKDKDKDLIKCVVIIFLGFLHRPFHLNLLSFFIIYSFLVMYWQLKRPRRLTQIAA